MASRTPSRCPRRNRRKRLAPLQEEIAALQEKLAKQKTAETEVRAWADRLVKQRLAWEPLRDRKAHRAEGKAEEPRATRAAFDLGSGRKETHSPWSRREGAARERRSRRCASSARRRPMRARARAGSRAGAAQQEQPLEMTGAVEGVSLKAVDAERIARPSARRSKPAAKPKPSEGRRRCADACRPARTSRRRRWCGELAEPFEAKGADETLECFHHRQLEQRRETEWRMLFTDAPADQLVAETRTRHRGEGSRQAHAGRAEHA